MISIKKLRHVTPPVQAKALQLLQKHLSGGGGDQVVQIQNFKIFAKSEFKISKFLKFRIAKCKLWGHIWKNRQV